MKELDPIVFCDQLRRTLARFISTSAPISQIRAPRLSQRFRHGLEAGEVALVKGPFVESLPDFRKDRSIAELVDIGAMAPGWRALSESSEGDRLFRRALHQHQAEAIGRGGENYLVATGTGSGKTEAFLLPLVDELLRDADLSTPGVRAILIYPLNALANDQMHRIARLLFKDLRDPGITIGRYTGQVRAGATRSLEERKLLESPTFQKDFGEARRAPANWMLTREEMLEKPPHILITNYAMLEHILLLPRNRGLLKDAKLRWMVLDEIHTYAGAQAIEVAFLIRKLKTRLALAPGQLKCVGTSASLDPDRKDELRAFAENLFGEAFPTGNRAVIVSNRQLHPALRNGDGNETLFAEQWITLGQIASDIQVDGPADGSGPEAWNTKVCEAGLSSLAIETGDFGDGLIALLGKNRSVRDAAAFLEARGAVPFEQLAQHLFPQSPRDIQHRACAALISLGVLAKPSVPGAFPLLPARYHIAASGVEGVCVRLDADDPEHWSEMTFGRNVEADDGIPRYPLLVCRNCGEPYIETWDDGRRLHAKPETRTKRLVLRLNGLAEDQAAEYDEDDGAEDDAEAGELEYFNPTTGEIADGPGHGIVGLLRAEMHDDDEEARTYVKRCSSCKSPAGRYPEPISAVHPGDDALAAVTAQELLECLPPPPNRVQDAPMGGRNLLVFSDNRQVVVSLSLARRGGG